MNRNNTPVWGITFVIIGIIVLLKAMGFFDVDILFWISLIIIVPCFLGLVNSKGDKWGYLIGMGFGLVLMLISFDVIRWGMFAPICIAAVFLLIGVKMITGKNHRPNDYYRNDQYGNQNEGTVNGQDDSIKSNYYTGGQYYSTNPNNPNDVWTNGVNNNNTAANTDNPGQSAYTQGNTEYTGQNVYTQANTGYTGQNVYTGTAYTVDSSGNVDTSGNIKAEVITPDNPGAGYNNDTTGNSSTGSYSNTGSNSNTGNNSYTGPRPENDSEYKAYSAVLCGRDINFHNEPFHGAMLSAVLGGIELNLRNAIITKDVNIDAKAVLGGVEIHVPRNAKTVINCTPVLGGLDDKTTTPVGMINCPTIYINATCVLGGVDVNY